jgi:hypothetical protein
MSRPITASSATAVSPAIVGLDNDVISSSCHGSTKQKVTKQKVRYRGFQSRQRLFLRVGTRRYLCIFGGM